MNRTILILAAAIAPGCTPSPTPNPPAPARTADQSPAPHAASKPQDPPMPVKTLDADLVASTLEDGGAVAVVRILASNIEQPGTRSESTRILCELAAPIFGKVADSFSLRRHTSAGDVVLHPGKLYVVATFPDPRFAPAFELTGFVETSEARIQDSVRAHQALAPGR